MSDDVNQQAMTEAGAPERAEARGFLWEHEHGTTLTDQWGKKFIEREVAVRAMVEFHRAKSAGTEAASADAARIASIRQRHARGEGCWAPPHIGEDGRHDVDVLLAELARERTARVAADATPDARVAGLVDALRGLESVWGGIVKTARLEAGSWEGCPMPSAICQDHCGPGRCELDASIRAALAAARGLTP